MPLYDFECKTCNKTYEVIVGIKDDWSKVPCEICGNFMSKLVTTPKAVYVEGGMSNKAGVWKNK